MTDATTRTMELAAARAAATTLLADEFTFARVRSIPENRREIEDSEALAGAEARRRATTSAPGSPEEAHHRKRADIALARGTAMILIATKAEVEQAKALRGRPTGQIEPMITKEMSPTALVLANLAGSVATPLPAKGQRPGLAGIVPKALNTIEIAGYDLQRKIDTSSRPDLMLKTLRAAMATSGDRMLDVAEKRRLREKASSLERGR